MSQNGVNTEAANDSPKTVKAFALVQNAVITSEGDVIKLADSADKKYPAVMFVSPDRERVVKAKHRAAKIHNSIRALNGNPFDGGTPILAIAEIEIPAPRKREAKPAATPTAAANGSEKGKPSAQTVGKK